VKASCKKKKRPKRRIVEVNIEKLDKLVDKSEQGPLSKEEAGLLKTAIHTMAAKLMPKRTTEKADKVLDREDGAGEPEADKPNTDNSGNGEAEDGKGEAAPQAPPKEEKKPRRPGDGRNGAADYTGATIVSVPHGELSRKCVCPACQKGKIYNIDAKPLVRIKGMPPIQATVTYLERLRCNLCGEIYEAEAPEGVGEDKYDTSVAPMVAQLHYGSGMPFNRIEKLQKQMGVPLPASTQFELVDEASGELQPVLDELINQAAQGQLATYDDTVARILEEVVRPATQDKDRTGLKTTGIVVEAEEHKIAIFLTGPQHAGENFGDLLKQRREGLPPIVGMSDALACNNPKVPRGVALLWVNCMTHGRRQFVDVYENFPDECRHVIEQIGLVYLHDEEARDQGLSPEARLSYHQQKSGPVMDELKKWMEAELEEQKKAREEKKTEDDADIVILLHSEEQKKTLKEKKTEPNSGLGVAIRYFLKRWDRLTQFLHHPGVPLDSNIVERALKKEILYRKNSLFYKNEHGAKVGDLFMSIIHTCELNKVNSFEYMHQLLRHAVEVQANPADWLPWNFHLQLRPVPD
jgi:transposase